MRARAAGFTITELMIVVLIVAVLTGLALPSMRDMVRNQRLKTTSFDVLASLTLARSEAIKRNLSVTLIPNGGDWTLGWVATDANGATVARQDAFIPVINGAPAPGASIAIDYTGPVNIVFAGTGRTNGVSKFSISSPTVAPGAWRCIRLDSSGRPSSSLGACT